MTAVRRVPPLGATLRRRFTLLYATGGVLMLAMLSAAVWSYGRAIDDANEIITRLDPLERHTSSYLTAVISQETGVRGYVLTGDESFLEPYEQGRQGEAVQAERVRRLVGEGAIGRQFREVRQAATRWQEDSARQQIAVTRVRGPEAVEDADLQLARQRFDEVRVGVEELQGEIERRRLAAISDLSRSQQLARSLLIGVAVVFTVLMLALTRLLKAWVIDPVEKLAADARAVRSGDLGHSVTVPESGPQEMVTLGRDIEAMRVRIIEELETVREAWEALERQAEDLSRSNADLEQFAYVASHDLQEPLRKVISFCQLLQRRYGGQLDERADQYIELAVDGASRMQRLINDLLDFSRVGRRTEGLDEVALDEVAERAVANLGTLIEETGAEIEVAPNLPVVSGDRSLLVSLLQNLIGNSIKYRRPDVVPRVSVEVSSSDEGHEIAVRDNGLGIEPEYADKVFIIFNRLHSREAYDGTGIGLAMAKKIVEFHGGRIWVDLNPGSPGTVVRFVLPPAAPADPTASRDEPDSRPASSQDDQDHHLPASDATPVPTQGSSNG